jgi:neutral ceramidase
MWDPRGESTLLAGKPARDVTRRPKLSTELQIGCATEIITPELGCLMGGFDARKGVAEKIHDNLHVRSLIFDDGRTQLALISVELLAVDRAFSMRVRSEVERRTGIPAQNVVIAATHTHCGPITLRQFFNYHLEPDPGYLDDAAAAIATCAHRAFTDRKERRVRAGMIPVTDVAVNRRTPDGKPVDPFAGVLMVEEMDGKPAAVVVNYACHTTVLGPNTLEITADFPFYTSGRLREHFGDRVEILYFNGAEGDLSIGHKSDLSAVGVIAPFRTFEKAKDVGERLANAVIEGLPRLAVEEPVLAVAHASARLPLKHQPPFHEVSERRRRAEAALRDFEAAGATGEELIRARQRSLFDRIEEFYALLLEKESGPDPDAIKAELIAARIGGTALVTFPGEVFVAIGLNIRDQSPFPRTLFIGLANDYIAYVPTAEADAAAGYEVVASRVTPAAAGVLANRSVELLNNLRHS